LGKFSAACAAISAISSSRLGSLGVARIIQPLIRKPIPPSRKILPASKSARNQATWAVTFSLHCTAA
jgi:amino acid transporter